MAPIDAYAYEGLSDAPISHDAVSISPTEIIEEEEETLNFDLFKKKVF